MRPAFDRDCEPRCGDDPEMTKALNAPGVRPGQKFPWCASAIEEKLIPAIRYFHRFLPILTEFSVREHPAVCAPWRPPLPRPGRGSWPPGAPALPRSGCCRLSLSHRRELPYQSRSASVAGKRQRGSPGGQLRGVRLDRRPAFPGSGSIEPSSGIGPGADALQVGPSRRWHRIPSAGPFGLLKGSARGRSQLVPTAWGPLANNPCTLNAKRSARKLVSTNACRSL